MNVYSMQDEHKLIIHMNFDHTAWKNTLNAKYICNAISACVYNNPLMDVY